MASSGDAHHTQPPSPTGAAPQNSRLISRAPSPGLPKALIIVAALAGLVAVLCGAAIGGYYLGRDTAPTESEAQVDMQASQNIATGIQTGAGTSGDVAITGAMLAADGSQVPEFDAVLEDSTGSHALSMQDTTVSQSGAEVTVHGKSSLMGVPTKSAIHVTVAFGVSHVIVEHTPTSNSFALASVLKAGSNATVPAATVLPSKTVLVLATSPRNWTFTADSAAAGRSLVVQSGLSVASRIRTGEIPETEALFRSVTPEPAAGSRRLATSPDWFKTVEHDLQGALSPKVKLTTSMGDLRVNDNLVIRNATLHLPNKAGASYTVTGVATVNVPGFPNVPVTGVLTNTSVSLHGVGPTWHANTGAGAVALTAATVSVTTDLAYPSGPAKSSASIGATLNLNGVPVVASASLPIANVNDFALNLANATLADGLKLTGATLTVDTTAKTSTLAAKLAVYTGLKSAYATFSTTGAVTTSGDSTTYSLAGNGGDLPLAAFATELTATSVSVTVSGEVTTAKGVPTGKINGGDISVGGATMSLDLPIPSPAAKQTVVHLSSASTTHMTVSDAASTICSTSCASLPSTIVDTIKSMTLENLEVAFTTSPLALTVSGTVDIAAGTVGVRVVSTKADDKWGYTVGVRVTDAFKFSDLVPAQTGFDHLSFQSGFLVVSTSAETFSFNVTDGKPIAAVQGATFGAKLAVEALESRMVSSGEWADVSPFLVNGSFATSASDLKLNAYLPSGLALTKDIALTSGSVELSTTSPMFKLTADAALTYSSTNPPLKFALGGDLGDSSYALTASIADWAIGADGVTVTSASLTLDGTKGASDAWTATGSVKGGIKFDDVTLQAVISLPVTKDHVDVEVPELALNDDVDFSNVQVTWTDNAGTKTFTLAGTAKVKFSGEDDLSFDATATITGSDITVTGSIPSWNIGGADGVKCTNVDFDMSGTYSSSPLALSGKLSGDVDFAGVATTFEVALPMAKHGELKLTVAHLDFGQDVVLDSLSLTVQETTPKYALAAQATIGTGLGHNSQAADDVSVSVAGWLNGAADGFTVQGTVASWGISSDFSIKDLVVNVTGTRKSSGSGTDLDGWLKGAMTFDSVTVDVEAALPADSLTVSFPTMRLTDDVVLKEVSMTITGSSDPSFTFTGTAEITTHMPSSPITVSATGSISGSTFDLTGTLSSWTVEVGHEGFTVSDLSVSIKDKVGGSGFAGSMTGKLDFDSLELDMSAALPGSATTGLDLTLTLKSGDTMTVGKAITATCGSKTVPAPAAMVTAVKAAAFSSVSMTIHTIPGSFELTGTVSLFGQTGLSARFLATHGSSAWEFGFGVAITSTFTVADIVPGATAWDFLELSSGGVAVATSSQKFTMPSSLGDLSVSAGVEVDAKLPLLALSKELDVVDGKWGSSGDVTVKGSFQDSTDALTLSASLPNNLPLGDDIKLNGTVSISTSEPKFSLNAAAALTIHEDMAPVLCSAQLAYTGSGDFQVTATADSYVLDFGKTGITIKQVKISATEKSGAVSGTFSGDAQFADGLELSASFEFPAAAGSGFELDLTLAAGKSMTATQLVKATCGDSAVSGLDMPSDFASTLSAEFLSASVKLQSSPAWSISATGKMSLFHISSLLAVELQIKQQSSDWHFGLGVGLGPDFKLGDVMPSVSSDALQSFDFSDGALVVSTFSDAFSFQIPNANAVKVTDGVALAASISLSQGKLAPIKSWTGIDALVVTSSFTFDSDSFTLKAAIDTDWTIADIVSFKSANLEFQVGGSLGVDIGVGADVAVNVQTQTLNFKGELKFSEDTMEMQVGMTTPWVSPFGVKGLTIGDVEFELGISYALVPDLLGFSGSLTIDGETGSATVFIDIADPKNNVIAASLPSMHLGGLISSLTDHKLPSALQTTIGDVGFKSMSLELNLGLTPLTFDNQTFAPGFRFMVSDLMLPFFGDLETSAGSSATSGSSSSRRLAGETRRLEGLLDGSDESCGNTNSGSSSGSGSGSSTGSGSGSSTGSGSGSSTGSGSGSSTGSGSGSGTGSSTDSGSNSGSSTRPVTGGTVDRLPVNSNATGGAQGISAEVVISKSAGVLVNASMAPIGWGNIFTLSGANGPDSFAQLELSVGDHLADDKVLVSGAATLLDSVDLSCYLSINDAGFDVNATFKVLVLDVVLQLSYEKAKTSGHDLSLYADVNTEMIANLTQSVINRLTEFKNDFDSRVSEATKAVNQWAAEEQPKITANKAKIAQYKAQDTAALSGVQKTLYDAQQTLANAQTKVSSLQTSINNDEAAKEDCSSWYDASCDAHNTWLDTKIAGLWTAMHAAEVALDAAQEAVKVAKEAVQKAGDVLPDVDPRVLALEAEDATLEAAKTTADAALTAAKDVVDGATDLMQWAISEMATAFTVDNVFFKADSMSGVKGGAQLELGGSGTVLGKSVSFDLKLDYPPSPSGIVDSFWTDIKSSVGISSSS